MSVPSIRVRACDDRPWGPGRPVFGTLRFMSSANTARKARVKAALSRYA